MAESIDTEVRGFFHFSSGYFGASRPPGGIWPWPFSVSVPCQMGDHGRSIQTTTSHITFADGSQLQVGDNLVTTNSDASGNTFFGASGNDQLIGLGGNGSLSGAAGNDKLISGAGDDTINVVHRRYHPVGVAWHSHRL